jgi:hypothetical protein
MLISPCIVNKFLKMFQQDGTFVQYFMLISPCIVNQFLRMFQQDGTFCTVFYAHQSMHRE